MLEIEIPHAVLIKHAIGLVHPAPSGRMMISRTVFFSVFTVEGVGSLHRLPAGESLDISGGAAVGREDDIERQRLLLVKLTQIQRYVIVRLTDGQAHTDTLDAVVVLVDADLRGLFLLLYGEEDIALRRRHPLNGVVVTEETGSGKAVVLCLGDADVHQHGSQEDRYFLHFMVLV